MPGACCTRGLVCNKCAKRRTRAYRYSRSIPAFPAQWFYGLCRALPGDEFLLPPSSANWRRSRARSGSQRLRRLDASHGRQDHTVLPYATTPLVLRGKQSLTAPRQSLRPPCDLSRAQRFSVHRSPHSTYRDDAYAPLHEAGWRDEGTAFEKGEADYFRWAIWTTQITLNRLAKFASARQAFHAILDELPSSRACRHVC